ncbi:HAD family hydrolase [Methanomassiliicoccus luminyensis]|jgi:putative hydrolase of the HAD superfamily|nr:HAD family hydrolase [Methanomassiliicoccus luminyensis]
MKAVLFDLGHTLIDYYCDWKGPEARGVGKMYELVSKSSPGEVDRREFSAYLGDLLVETRERKLKEMVEVPLVDVLGRCLERYDVLDEDNLQEGLEIFYGVLLEDRKLVPGAEEMLSRVKEKGLKIGLISDVAWGLPSEFPLRDIEHYGLTDFFDDMVFSTDVGLRKPHPKIFKIALSNLSVAAADSMYVGNSLKQDIKGAKGVGMKAVLKRSQFCPYEEGVMPDHTVSELQEVDAILDAK